MLAKVWTCAVVGLEGELVDGDGKAKPALGAYQERATY